jgi:acyl-CoA thioester hydrolase
VLVNAASGKPQRIGDDLRAAWAPYVEPPVQFTKRGA